MGVFVGNHTDKNSPVSQPRKTAPNNDPLTLWIFQKDKETFTLFRDNIGIYISISGIRGTISACCSDTKARR